MIAVSGFGALSSEVATAGDSVSTADVSGVVVSAGVAPVVAASVTGVSRVVAVVVSSACTRVVLARPVAISERTRTLLDR